MSYVIKTQNFTLNDGQKKLAESLGISETFLRLLLGRGFESGDIGAYLHPSVENMSSPCDIDGMNRAVARVREAIDKKQKILVYGDYDCDGICAVSVLVLYLRDKARVTYFIPDRNRDGYGLSVSALEKLIASQRPDLVITVDCGITAVEETEFLRAHGIDIIITDHHEPQKRVPNCIVLDPKIQRRGFCDYCGAGVALKLVEALGGREEACKYLDIVAIATVADVVPLIGDNRIIAYYGIKQMQKSPRKGIKMLLGDDACTSQNIMFRLAPRMNAAGRLSSAMKVVGLFLEDDYFMLRTLAEELIRENLKRQELCEDVVRDAKRMLRGTVFGETGIIALYSDKWEAGVLGIAASHLVEEFKRPTVLFAKSDGKLKGSARSVPSVNIFELFSNLSGYFTSFGGHAQAAGVSLFEKDFARFKQDANELILKEHKISEFVPDRVCEMSLPLDFDFLSFAKELELMQPVGYGNPRPNFLISADGLKFEKIGYSRHVKCNTPNIDFVGFNDYSESLLSKTGRIQLEVSLDINTFRNSVSAQGVLRSLKAEDITLSDDEAVCLNMHHLEYEGGAYVSRVETAVIEEKLKASPFGTLIVCFSKEDYVKIYSKSSMIGELPVYVGNVPELNPCNCAVVCPCREFEFGYYETVAIAGAPLTSGYLLRVSDSSAKCVALCDTAPRGISASDDELRSVYKAILSVAVGKTKANNMHALYLQVNERYKVSESKFLLALRIFGELGLVRLGERGDLTVSRKSVSLNDSLAYRNIAHTKNSD